MFFTHPHLLSRSQWPVSVFSKKSPSCSAACVGPTFLHVLFCKTCEKQEEFNSLFSLLATFRTFLAPSRSRSDITVVSGPGPLYSNTQQTRQTETGCCLFVVFHLSACSWWLVETYIINLHVEGKPVGCWVTSRHIDPLSRGVRGSAGQGRSGEGLFFLFLVLPFLWREAGQ